MPYDVDILLLGVQVIDQELRKRSDVRFGRQLGVWAIDLYLGFAFPYLARPGRVKTLTHVLQTLQSLATPVLIGCY